MPSILATLRAGCSTYSTVLSEITTVHHPYILPEGANFDPMSKDPQAFDTDISTGDTTLFAPLLQEDLTKLPPSFTITNRLNKSNFLEQAPDEAHNTFLNDLKSIEEYFEQGYVDNPDRDLCLTIDKNQFICGAA